MDRDAGPQQGTQPARDARRTVSASMCSPGVMIRILTPRFAALTSAAWVSASGTKYALDKSIDRVAAVIASRYMSRMLSLPPSGELLKTWPRLLPATAIAGKYPAPCRTLPVTLIQLSMKTACIWATTGPSARKCGVAPVCGVLRIAGPFVSNADPTREADPAVYDQQLAMGSIVEPRR